MGKQQRAELVNRLKVLLMHLAQWQHQPTLRAAKGNSWRGSIDVQRIEIERHVRKNPCLQPVIEEAMAEAWTTARIEAATDAGLSRETFAVACPFTWQQAMREDWLPD